MKTPSTRFLILCATSFFALTACGRAESKVAAEAAPSAPPPDAAPMFTVPTPTTAETVARLKGHTYEQRADFALLVRELELKADAALAGLNAGYIEIKSTPARRKAMESFRAATMDFKDKGAKVDNAKAENWESITSNLATSWQNLQGAEAKIRRETK